MPGQVRLHRARRPTRAPAHAHRAWGHFCRDDQRGSPPSRDSRRLRMLSRRPGGARA